MSLPAGLLASLLLLQNPAELFQKAPPAVDEALRARVTRFFQAHVDGKFRAAEEVVAEESKDAFYTADKPRYLSFEISQIEYSENFTRAQVTVMCEINNPAPGLTALKMKIPRLTWWKLDAGQWGYLIDPKQGRKTPFGGVQPGPGQTTGPSGTPPAVPPSGPAGADVDVEALLAWVKSDKSQLHFSSAKAGRDELTLTNRGPALATLSLAVPDMPGFEARLEARELKPGEATRVTARWEPGKIPPPPKIRIQVLARPTNQILDMWAVFAQEPVGPPGSSSERPQKAAPVRPPDPASGQSPSAARGPGR